MLRISKNAGLTDIVSTGQKPFIRKSDSVQVDYSEIPGYPATADMSLYNTNPAYNPLTTQHPIAGSTVIEQKWLFNDLSTERFENINLDPTDATGSDESTWVQLSADGTTFLAAGTALSMANISDNNVGKPFWVKITTPSVGSVQNKTDIKLTVNYRKFAV